MGNVVTKYAKRIMKVTARLEGVDVQQQLLLVARMLASSVVFELSDITDRTARHVQARTDVRSPPGADARVEYDVMAFGLRQELAVEATRTLLNTFVDAEIIVPERANELLGDRTFQMFWNLEDRVTQGGDNGSNDR